MPDFTGFATVFCHFNCQRRDFIADTRQTDKNIRKIKENDRKLRIKQEVRQYIYGNKIKKNEKNILTGKKRYDKVYRYENKEEYPLSP